jgi:hypothetical protein
MPFTEQQKLQIRKRAHFCCCLCHETGVEIHHIIPQAEGGPDNEDNAAPLCPTCHEIYGGNPAKRKFIREVRDFWYELCAQRYSTDHKQLKEIADRVEKTASRDDVNQAMNKIIEAISGAKAVPSVKADDMLAIELPIKYWCIVLVGLQQLIKISTVQFQEMHGKGLTLKDLNPSPEYTTALVGPLIANSMIIDALAEAGVITKDAGDQKGTKAILNLINAYKNQPQ